MHELGRDTNIWKDRWIPNLEEHSLPARTRVRDESLRLVCDLMTEDGKEWNHELIFQVFEPSVAQKIAAIPIAKFVQADQICWKFNKNGDYSVMSGYWVAKRLKDATSSIPSSSSNSSDYWKQIWSLNIQPKIKIFLWKCFKGILPTAQNLIRRGVLVDPICLRCGEEEESLEHCLRNCRWSAIFWKLSKLRIQDAEEDQTPFHVWFQKITKGKPIEFSEVFVILLWVNWKARNQRVFQNKILSWAECLNMANMMLWDFKKANSENQETNTLIDPGSQRFSGETDWACLKSDASISSDKGCGMGYVIHDHQGNLIEAKAIHCPVTSCIEIGEARACLDGLTQAREKGIRKIKVEMDNQNIVFLIQKGEIPKTELGTVMADIHEEAKKFNEIKFGWIRRNQNKEAHCLANHARNIKRSVFDANECCMILESLLYLNRNI